jgi:hypothetical protein
MALASEGSHLVSDAILLNQSEAGICGLGEALAEAATFRKSSDFSLNLAIGLTVREVARRYRVGEDKVRGWIARGELAAVNTASALCGRPRWVVLPESLTEFERRRKGGTPPKQKPRRRRPEIKDYYPD